MTKKSRPWDKPSRKRPVVHETAPFVEIEGTKFWSDRYYLNETVQQQQQNQQQQPTNSTINDNNNNGGCPCKNPPRFSRSKLVASLNVEACIMATYTFQPSVLWEEFPSLANVPTLVMHGCKGKRFDNDDDDYNNDDDSSVESQRDEESPSLGKETRSSNNDGSLDMFSKLHFCEIQSTWMPHIPPSIQLDQNGALSETMIQLRRSRRGVHHPKFLLLVERDSLVLVISTANLTSQHSTDASWVQRFPLLSPNNSNNTTTNDFGRTLAHFLQSQTLATAPRQTTLQSFVQAHLGWKSVTEIQHKYDYNAACVELVGTVPGDYPHRNPHKWGQQRMAQLLQNHTCLQGDHNDRLVWQPTSLGGEWNVQNLTELVEAYGGTTLHDIDIVWPTDHFMQSASSGPTNGTGEAFATETSVEWERRRAGFLFLSADTFNSISMDCLKQMAMYEPTDESKYDIPHIKSYCRLYGGSNYKLRKHYGAPKCSEYLSWFLLTSACLSRGAQGEQRNDTNSVGYQNFELGVLFKSKLGRNERERIYCYQPSTCTCDDAKMIHLPIPFELRPTRYVQDEELDDFCETPYFHEIPSGSGHVGHMQLTPLGQVLAAKIEQKRTFVAKISTN